LAVLHLARKQGALAWELRAAMNLGKLWATQSRERDALDLLEPLYGRFTEGFEFYAYWGRHGSDRPTFTAPLTPKQTKTTIFDRRGGADIDQAGQKLILLL
jgi:hypothetical protein